MTDVESTPIARGFAAVAAHRVVPVVRTPTPELARLAVDWLGEVGLRTFEITMTIPDGEALIAELAKSCPADVLIGAGTVMSPEQAERCIDAGARYVVTPVIVDGLPAVCARRGVPCVLGASTPNEVWQAWRAGATGVKVFPISQLGGPGYLKAIRSVLPQVPLIPTGGIPADGFVPYLEAGAAFVGVGGKLVDVAALKAGDKAAIQDAGRAALAAASASPR